MNVTAQPTELQLEVTGACNLACKMCLVRYRPKLGRRSGAMCFHTFRDVVDALPGLRKLTLQGLGEPLLAPDFFRMVTHATARGISTGFNTNGTFLTPDVSERLIRLGVDWLHVSLDGATPTTYESIRDGADFGLVTRNIRGLVGTRRRLGADRPTVQIVFVAMRRNLRELPALVKLAAEWGVEAVWVQNLSHSFGDTDPSGSYLEIRRFAAREALWQGEYGRAKAVFEEARELGEQLGVDVRLPRLREPEAPAPLPGGIGCHWPFESAYVTHDGKVQPCCMVMGADRAVLGSLEEAGFEEIWRSEPYETFRAGLRPGGDPPEVCKGCSLYRRVF
jgi:radical SAM protein with 4Fe4S-binding SPASM domain